MTRRLLRPWIGLLALASSSGLTGACDGEPEAGGDVGTVQGPLTGCVPGPNQASIFVDGNFGGSCWTLGIGKYPHATQIGLANDSISSLRAGANVAVRVCKADQWDEGCWWPITGNQAVMRRDGFDDSVSSIEVYPIATTIVPSANAMDPNLTNPSWRQAAVFGAIDFGGVRDVLPVGNYPNNDPLGIPNDQMSAVKVGAGVKVTLCQDVSFGGFCQTLQGDEAFLGDLTIGNDTVTSMTVAWKCGFDLCAIGAAIPPVADPSCDPCVAAICQAAPVCCNPLGRWDPKFCAGNVPAICGRSCI